jgi:polysaccharide export outer membrane protein
MAACLFVRLPLPSQAQTAAETKAPDKSAFYVLHPMDLVKILVYHEPELEREVRVSQDHTLVMPLIGPIDVRNRTVRDTEKLITELYARDYLVNPQINLLVLEYGQRTVNVFGAVNTPGSVVIPPEKEFRLLDAVGRAGGFSRLSNRSRVTLTRTHGNGQTESFIINADQLMSGDSANKWALQEGDVIVVPERML